MTDRDAAWDAVHEALPIGPPTSDNEGHVAHDRHLGSTSTSSYWREGRGRATVEVIQTGRGVASMVWHRRLTACTRKRSSATWLSRLVGCLRHQPSRSTSRSFQQADERHRSPDTTTAGSDPAFDPAIRGRRRLRARARGMSVLRADRRARGRLRCTRVRSDQGPTDPRG